MKILNLASKIASAISIFIVPIIIVIKRYNKTTVTIESTNGLGLVPTIFIALAIIIGLYWLINQVRATMANNPFSWFSILLYGSVFGLALFGVWFGVNSITISAQTQLNDFIATMSYHRTTLFYMLYPIGGGIGLAGVMWGLNIKFTP